MTTILNIVTSKFVDSTPKGALIGGMAVLIVILLLSLLIAKVLIDAYGSKANPEAHTFTIVILTFLFVLVKVGFLRIAQILHLI